MSELLSPEKIIEKRDPYSLIIEASERLNKALSNPRAVLLSGYVRELFCAIELKDKKLRNNQDFSEIDKKHTVEYAYSKINKWLKRYMKHERPFSSTELEAIIYSVDDKLLEAASKSTRFGRDGIEGYFGKDAFIKAQGNGFSRNDNLGKNFANSYFNEKQIENSIINQNSEFASNPITLDYVLAHPKVFLANESTYAALKLGDFLDAKFKTPEEQLLDYTKQGYLITQGDKSVLNISKYRESSFNLYEASKFYNDNVISFINKALKWEFVDQGISPQNIFVKSEVGNKVLHPEICQAIYNKTNELISRNDKNALVIGNDYGNFEAFHKSRENKLNIGSVTLTTPPKIASFIKNVTFNIASKMAG